jgi:6-pyruvoyltetrahydropterin/6-carboxytetrahydropterin synthase
VASRALGPAGIVLDFGILKQRLEAILQKLDHTDLNSLPYFSKREPSSENIAKYVYDEFKKALQGEAVSVRSVTAWESETSSATYLGGRA